jgi:hypothetical protein
MADKKISALTSATTPLAGTEVLPIVQSGATVKVAVSDLTAGRAISATAVTASTGNFIIGTAGQGVDFSIDPAAAGMTSELLDDYEEGTWTAKLYDASSGGNASATTATGYYTKIGNQVTLTVGNFNNISTAGMTLGNFMRMGDLPFTPAQNSAGSMTVGTWDFDPGYTAIIPVTVGTSSRLSFWQVGDNVAEVVGIAVGALTSGTSDMGRMTITYFV